jgi:peptide/nickel transport system substrate-binding protein
LLAVATVSVAATTSSAFGQDGDGGSDEKVTLNVGITQDMDSPNVSVGVLVPNFDVWNLQFATLTDKAADDFETIPGLAESWEESDGGLTYTYTLRDGLVWSDGEPLTAEDIAYTINRSRDEEWLNHYSTVANIEAEAIDDTTVRITSSVPDPKLPTMDVYIVPKHIYEEISAEDLASYDAMDGVASGPFRLVEWQKGEFWRMEANPDYWQGAPAIDEIIFRPFTNADAMVAALENGELDAAHNIPASRYEQLSTVAGIEVVQGQQGGFDELAINAGDGLDGHPALADVQVRQAIAHAIDKETIVERALSGIGTPTDALSPSANPEWQVELTDEERFEFDLDEANRILDEAGYEDTDGDGVREMPGGGEPLNFVYAERSEGEYSAAEREFITGWLDEIGIATTVEVFDDTQLTPEIGKGAVDLFVWGWTPYVDPDPMLSYLTCDQIATDPEDPTNYYNDANWCNEEYDELYAQQNQELDHERRVEIVHDMLRVMYDDASYVVLYTSPDLQAYRTDKFEGWTKQPAEIGPVLFTNTSPTYFNLQPVSGAAGASDDDGIGTAAVVAIAVVAVLVIGGGILLFTRRRATAGERE